MISCTKWISYYAAVDWGDRLKQIRHKMDKKHTKENLYKKNSLSWTSLTFLPLCTFPSYIPKRQSGSINAQQIYLTAAIKLLFVLTDGVKKKSNPILFRAAIAQNQYYIRRPDEFEICTQSEY